jgi:uncharacterized damage-inducible protein DinB
MEALMEPQPGLDLRYPIGKFKWPEDLLSEEQRRRLIEDIAETPARLRAAVAGLSPEQLETQYRPEGWTVKQVVHHVPDSHLNAYIRFKLALTEDEPMVKTYKEGRWAELADSRGPDIETSLRLLESLHGRWVSLLRSLGPADFARTFRHPDLGLVPLDKTLALYAWHGKHHVAHITSLRQRMGWRESGYQAQAS